MSGSMYNVCMAVLMTAVLAMVCTLIAMPSGGRRLNFKSTLEHVVGCGLIYPVIPFYIYWALDFLGGYIK